MAIHPHTHTHTCTHTRTHNTHTPQHTTHTPGKLLIALVREFLEWAGLEFTVKVFEPEVGSCAEYHGRMGLSKQLVGAAGSGSGRGSEWLGIRTFTPFSTL
jgi:hypothetical protein